MKSTTPWRRTLSSPFPIAPPATTPSASARHRSSGLRITTTKSAITRTSEDTPKTIRAVPRSRTKLNAVPSLYERLRST